MNLRKNLSTVNINQKISTPQSLSSPEPISNTQLLDLKEFKLPFYAFDPEISIQDYDGMMDFRYMVHGSNQIKDMVAAYQYAEEVLQNIRDSGIDQITPDQLLDIINNIHLRMAKTLAEDYKTYGVSAGKYTNEQIYRWHYGIEFSDIAIVNYFSGKIDIDQTVKEFGCDKVELQHFFSLLKKILEDKSTIDTELKQNSNKPTDLRKLAILKLEKRFHENKLTQEEQLIVNKFITICAPPEKLPNLMKEYAKNLLKKWKICDPNNIDEIATTAYFLFYQLTEIHPYFNANGRSATCFLNIFLRFVNQPSIFLRDPNDKDNEKSSYSLAIKEINTNPSLFINHIKIRLKTPPYEDAHLKKMVMLRVKCSEIFSALQTKLEVEKINLHYSTLYSKIPQIISELRLDTVQDEEIAVAIIENFISYFSNLLKQCDSERKTAQTTLIPSPVIQRQYTSDEKTQIVTKLDKLTDQKGWKVFKEKNSIAVLLTMEKNMDTKEKNMKTKAENLTAALQNTNALQARLMRDPRTKDPIIKVNLINLEKLKQVEFLENTILPLPEQVLKKVS